MATSPESINTTAEHLRGTQATLEKELAARLNARLVGRSALEPLAFSQDPDAPWQDRALCAQTDPEAFFPERGGSKAEAKKVCTSCEVRKECLEYAVEHDERFGIWGGLSERERRKLKRRAV